MTINVVMIRTALGADDRQWRQGQTYAAPDDFAALLIGRGDAYAPAGELQDVPRGSSFTPVTAAEVAAGSGVEGQSYRISDGADAGAELLFTSGYGIETPSFRWKAWPQAEYEAP